MRIRPLNLGDDAGESYGLGAIVLGSKGMMREEDGGEGRQAGREPHRPGNRMCHVTPRSISLRQTPWQARDESGGDHPIGSLHSHAPVHVEIPLSVLANSTREPGRKHVGVSSSAYFGSES